MRIYLCGPITGHTKTDIRSWRRLAADLFRNVAEVVDPTLAQYDAAVAFERKETAGEAVARLRHGLFVVRRNKDLIRSCDILLANFLGATDRTSIGSVGEIYWADAFGKPVIIIREERGNIHDHAMLNAIASRICYSLDDAFEAIASNIAATTVPKVQSG